MPTASHLCRFVISSGRRAAWSVLVALGLVTAQAAPAHAISGLYIQLGGGIADYSGTQLIFNELDNAFPDTDPSTCCAPTAIGAQLRLGYSIFGFGGPEFSFVGTGWNSFGGGGGFIGGGIRLYPLKFFTLAGVDVDSFPLELTTGVNFGYTLVGEDFAYTGTYWDIDVGLDYKVTSFMSIGARLDIILPDFDDFVFTSFSNDRGRCLDGSGNQ
ncbi:MAG: hypothetical protein AAF449_22765, partial [Myxococcota bacterium]